LYPVIGDPFAIGSSQLIVTNSFVLVVVITSGGSGLKAHNRVIVSLYVE
jgi:hypothetical protein